MRQGEGSSSTVGKLPGQASCAAAIASADPVSRDVEFVPTKAPYDPRHMLAGTTAPSIGPLSGAASARGAQASARVANSIPARGGGRGETDAKVKKLEEFWCEKAVGIGLYNEFVLWWGVRFERLLAALKSKRDEQAQKCIVFGASVRWAFELINASGPGIPTT